MSFDVYLAWLVRREQNEDRLREIRRHRLVQQVWAARRKQVLTTRSRYDRVFIRALTWLGRCLVAWGQRLQERYGVGVETPALHAANQPGS